VLLEDERSPLPAVGEPTVVNAGGWGVYRVAYDDQHRGALAMRLGELTPLERANLFADTWALVLAGRAGLSAFLDLAAGLGDQLEPVLYTTVAGALALCDRAADDATRPDLAAATRRLLHPRLEALGWDPREGEGERIPSVRSVLVSVLGTVGDDEAVREEAARRFDAAGVTGGPTLNPDLESAILAVVADQRRQGDYDTFYARYRAATTPQEEQRYLGALAAFPDLELGARTFDLALHTVRTQDAPYLIIGLLTNRVTGPHSFEELTEHWDEVLERFPANSHSRMVQGVRTLCSDTGVARRVTEFLAAHPVRTGQRSVDQAVERLWVNVGFVERERPGLGDTLGRVGT
jgi:puromycin-sensitive aminopeptidase